VFDMLDADGTITVRSTSFISSQMRDDGDELLMLLDCGSATTVEHTLRSPRPCARLRRPARMPATRRGCYYVAQP
jgi:hypothetical protein